MSLSLIEQDEILLNAEIDLEIKGIARFIRNIKHENDVYYDYLLCPFFYSQPRLNELMIAIRNHIVLCSLSPQCTIIKHCTHNICNEYIFRVFYVHMIDEIGR